MARRVKEVSITDEGRDKGKTFIITEMPASQAEKWAARALLVVSRSGVELPEGVEGSGFAGVAVMGLRALFKVDFEELEPLMDEMMECVTWKPPRPDIPARALIEADIEEVATRLQLRKEVLELHTGFSLADGRLNTTLTPPATPRSSPPRTSRAPSPRS